VVECRSIKGLRAVELLDQRLEHNTDEACVAYVAMTRARTSLTLHPDFMDTLKASRQAAAGKRPERVIRDQQREARYIPPPRRGRRPRGRTPRGSLLKVRSRGQEFRIRRAGKEIATGVLPNPATELENDENK
jgi:hypothetical protein